MVTLAKERQVRRLAVRLSNLFVTSQFIISSFRVHSRPVPGYVLRVDTRSSPHIAEVKMDSDGEIEFIPVMMEDTDVIQYGNQRYAMMRVSVLALLPFSSASLYSLSSSSISLSLQECCSCYRLLSWFVISFLNSLAVLSLHLILLARTAHALILFTSSRTVSERFSIICSHSAPLLFEYRWR